MKLLALLCSMAAVHCGIALHATSPIRHGQCVVTTPAARSAWCFGRRSAAPIRTLMASKDPLADTPLVPKDAPPPAGFDGEGFTNYMLPYAGMTVLAFGFAFGAFYYLVVSST